MAPSKAAVANSAYAKDERVLCFHHDMLYEAKILDVRKGEEKDGEQNSWKYKIHYKGWKNTCSTNPEVLGVPSPAGKKLLWDDWVSQDRVRKFSDENKELAAQLHNQLKDVKHGKSSKKRTQGSDFSSARGSEERHASTAAQNGRGAASRRNRDYDLDNLYYAAMSISSSGDLDYGSDTTISEDWDAMYHLHDCNCGNHHNAAEGFVEPNGTIVDGEQVTIAHKIVQLFRGRKRVSENIAKMVSPRRPVYHPSKTVGRIIAKHSISRIAKRPASWKISDERASRIRASSKRWDEYLKIPTPKRGHDASASSSTFLERSKLVPIEHTSDMVGFSRKVEDEEILRCKNSVKPRGIKKSPAKSMLSSSETFVPPAVTPVAESKNGPTAPSPQRLILTLKTHSPPEFKARLAAELERNGVSGNGSKSFTQSPPAQSEAFTLLPITPPTSKHKRKRKASVAKNSTPNKKTRPTLRYSKMFSRALRAQRYPPSQLIDHEIEEDEEDESDDEVQVQVKVGNGGEDEPDDANGPVPATEGNRASRTTRRSGDLVALDVDGSIFRRKAMSSWNDPKSEDWDVLRVLHDDDMLAKDNLLRLPPKNFTYIDSNGKLRDPNKYHEVKPSSSTPPHPKLVYHMKNGTDTPTLRKYYEDMPRNRNIPIAGMVDIPETGSGWEPDLGLRGQKAQQNKAIEIKAKAKIDIRSLEVRDTNDDSSSPSSLTSTEEVTFPGMLEKFSDEQSSYEHDPEKYYMVLARLTKAILTGNKIYQEDTFHAKPMVQLPVPDHIKAILVDDWENVTKNQQLVPLPAKVSVTVILDDYIEYESGRRLTGTPQSDLLPEVVTGLKEYFEKCLGRVLLYRFERSQYQEVREGMGAKEGEFAGKTICDIYGAEHLCRLIVTLPELIAQTNMDTQSVNRLREELTKMTMWLGKNASKYFNNEYETPGAEYIEKARSG
ncbi:keratinolytic protein [Diplocarpon rosae]|nr:keratinolytic protein [Diplocarpon rosae]